MILPYILLTLFVSQMISQLNAFKSYLPLYGLAGFDLFRGLDWLDFFFGGMVSHRKYGCFSSHPRSPLKSIAGHGTGLEQIGQSLAILQGSIEGIFKEKPLGVMASVGVGWGRGCDVVIFGLIFVSRIGRQLWAKRCCDMLV